MKMKKVIGKFSGIERKDGVLRVEWERVAKATGILDLNAVLLEDSMNIAM